MEIDFQKSLANTEAAIKKTAFSIVPEKCMLFQNTKTEKHYTIVVILPDEISTKIMSFIDKLKQIEPTLLTGAKDFLHLTIYYLPDDRNLKDIEETLENFFKHCKFDFKLSHMFNTHRGIGIAGIPTNDNFIKLRKLLGARFHFPYRFLEFEPVSWITIARFRKNPSKELIDYLKSHYNDNFGEVNLKEVKVFQTCDKNLVGAKELFAIKIQ